MTQPVVQLMTLEQVKDAIHAAVRSEVGFIMREVQTAKTIFTAREAAEYLSLSPSTLGHWRSEGRGPVYTKEGKRVHYLKKDIEAWASEHRIMTAERTA